MLFDLFRGLLNFVGDAEESLVENSVGNWELSVVVVVLLEPAAFSKFNPEAPEPGPGLEPLLTLLPGAEPLLGTRSTPSRLELLSRSRLPPLLLLLG